MWITNCICPERKRLSPLLSGLSEAKPRDDTRFLTDLLHWCMYRLAWQIYNVLNVRLPIGNGSHLKSPRKTVIKQFSLLLTDVINLHKSCLGKRHLQYVRTIVGRFTLDPQGAFFIRSFKKQMNIFPNARWINFRQMTGSEDYTTYTLPWSWKTWDIH